MSKLFEEVLNPNIPTSADFYIYFKTDSRVLRCHSLVLQTQKTLVDNLAAADVGTFGCTPSSPVSADRRDDFCTTPDDASDDRTKNSTQPRASVYTVMSDVSVAHVLLDEDPEMFTDIVRFLYTNTLNLETTSSVLDMLKLADKYGIEDVVDKCMGWVQEHSSADVFYSVFNVGIIPDAPDEKSWKSDNLLAKVDATLRRMLASRRIFQSITEDSRWGTLPASAFASFMMDKNISITGEDEIINLLVRWLSVTKDAAAVWKILETWKLPQSMLFRPHEWVRLMQLLEGDDEALFSEAPRRMKNVKLNPSFAVHRDAPTFIGSKSLSIPQRGIRLQTCVDPVTMHPRDLLLQECGFACTDKDIPRLRVKLQCVVWSHKEKRSHRGHSWSAGSSSLPLLMGEQLSEKIPELPVPWEGMKSVSNEEFEFSDSQHGGMRSRQMGTAPQVPEHMRVEHQIICGVVSGSGLRSTARMRHVMTISQEDRTSLFKLVKGKQIIYFGGTPTSIEFELALDISERSNHDICECSLKLYGIAIENGPPVLEENFSASAQEPLHFFVCSAFFDANSSYQVDLKWVDDLIQQRPLTEDAEYWADQVSSHSQGDSDDANVESKFSS